MDDFVVFSNSINSLKNKLEKISLFLNEHLKLTLKEQAQVLNTKMHGLDFLGFRIFPNMKRIQRASLKRIYKNIQIVQADLDRGIIAEKTYAVKMNAFFNHLGFADSFHLRSDLIKGCSQ